MQGAVIKGKLGTVGYGGVEVAQGKKNALTP